MAYRQFVLGVIALISFADAARLIVRVKEVQEAMGPCPSWVGHNSGHCVTDNTDIHSGACHDPNDDSAAVQCLPPGAFSGYQCAAPTPVKCSYPASVVQENMAAVLARSNHASSDTVLDTVATLHAHKDTDTEPDPDVNEKPEATESQADSLDAQVPGESDDEQKFAVGQRVSSQYYIDKELGWKIKDWGGNQGEVTYEYFPGVIMAVNADGTYKIKPDELPESASVPASRVKPIQETTQETKVTEETHTMNFGFGHCENKHGKVFWRGELAVYIVMRSRFPSYGDLTVMRGGVAAALGMGGVLHGTIPGIQVYEKIKKAREGAADGDGAAAEALQEMVVGLIQENVCKGFDGTTATVFNNN